MKFLRLATTTALVTFAGSALAADIVIVPPPPAPIPVIIQDPAFTGPYWGVYGGIGSGGQRVQRVGPMVGTQFGYNLAANSLRFGFEVETEYYRAATALVDATLNGRVGVVLGTNILLYGQGGIGTYINIPIWTAGGGIELALGTNLALFVEGKAMWFMGGGPGIDAWSIRGGVNYYADEDNLDAAGAFDWGGLYFGAHGGAIFGGPIAASPIGHFGVQVGYNLGGGPLLFGLEVETSHSFGTPARINASLNARAGAAFGSFLLYGEAGIGTFVSAVPLISAGGGAEIALGANLGLFAEGKALFALGGAYAGMMVNGGMNIHFGH